MLRRKWGHQKRGVSVLILLVRQLYFAGVCTRLQFYVSQNTAVLRRQLLQVVVHAGVRVSFVFEVNFVTVSDNFGFWIEVQYQFADVLVNLFETGVFRGCSFRCLRVCRHRQRSEDG